MSGYGGTSGHAGIGADAALEMQLLWGGVAHRLLIQQKFLTIPLLTCLGGRRSIWFAMD